MIEKGVKEKGQRKKLGERTPFGGGRFKQDRSKDPTSSVRGQEKEKL